MLRDFKPALLFLAKFLAFYFIANIIYGIYVESCGNLPDMFTQQVSTQTAFFLKKIDSSIDTEISKNEPQVSLKSGGEVVLNVFEGCNGINVMIVFVAFLIAFGGQAKKLVWFLFSGLIIIHLTNIMRLSLLYYVAQHYKIYFYFIHKYIFTAILYLIVIVLWVIWVFKVNVKSDQKAH